MAICNLFGPLKQDGGTFLTFSQYMEDLTRERVEGSNYRIVPSKFVALNIPYDEKPFDNESLPLLFQNGFENGCALGKNDTSKNWTPTNSKSVFWTAFLKYLNLPNYESESGVFDGYIGDINIHSYNVYDGIGYSEIYCHIPSEAKYNQYKLNISHINNGGEYWENKAEYEDLLVGYNDKMITKIIESDSNIIYEYEKSYEFQYIKSLSNTFFEINTIILLYDIYKGDSIAYQEIPLGIYFTGPINGDMSNHVTKFVTNGDIYNSGTSYGLKICSRFVATSYSDGILETTTTTTDESYDSLTKLLSEISITHNKLDSIINGSYRIDQNYKELLSIFKNSKTNVPYLKHVDGVGYWFVNGKLIGPATYNDDPIGKYEFKAWWTNDSILDINEYNGSYKNYINWSLTKNGIDITPETISLDDFNTNLDVKNHTYDIILNSSNTGTHEYTLSATVKGEDNPLSVSLFMDIVYPSYIGLVDEKIDVFNDSNKQLNINKRVDYKYNNTNLKHICFAYPASFGKLISIIDGRDIEYINDFEMNEEKYNGTEYFVYIDKNPANVTNYTLKFR